MQDFSDTDASGYLRHRSRARASLDRDMDMNEGFVKRHPQRSVTFSRRI